MLESWTSWESEGVRKEGLGRPVVVVVARGRARDRAVAGVAGEVDGGWFCSRRWCGYFFYGPRSPQCGSAVGDGSGGDMLAGEAGDAGGYCVG